MEEVIEDTQRTKTTIVSNPPKYVRVIEDKSSKTFTVKDYLFTTLYSGKNKADADRVINRELK